MGHLPTPVNGSCWGIFNPCTQEVKTLAPFAAGASTTGASTTGKERGKARAKRKEKMAEKKASDSLWEKI